MIRVIGIYIRDILSYLPQFFAAAVLFRVYRVAKLKKKAVISPIIREILMMALIVCMLIILSQTVLEDLDTFLSDGCMELINTLPFNFTEYWHVKEYFVINVLGNILFFLPIGYLAAFLFHGNALVNAALTGLGLSLFVEICQLPLLRTTDIDDLMLNTLGAIIGYLLYRATIRLLPETKDKFKVIK